MNDNNNTDPTENVRIKKAVKELRLKKENFEFELVKIRAKIETLEYSISLLQDLLDD